MNFYKFIWILHKIHEENEKILKDFCLIFIAFFKYVLCFTDW